MFKLVKLILYHIQLYLKDETGSMNFGVGRNGVAATFALNSYFYDDLVYRRYVTRIALDFYTGRQDTYIWYDLQKQFREIAA